MVSALGMQKSTGQAQDLLNSIAKHLLRVTDLELHKDTYVHALV
jgi:hypothetical protein